MFSAERRAISLADLSLGLLLLLSVTGLVYFNLQSGSGATPAVRDPPVVASQVMRPPQPRCTCCSRKEPR